jgi:hypothetical protein
MISLMLFCLCPAKGQIQDTIIDPYPGLDPNWGWISPAMKHHIDSINKAWSKIFLSDITFSVTPSTPNITLQDLLDYQKECYDDSTHVGTILYLGQDSIIDGQIVGTIYNTREEYDHLHYPTFESFIEFMKKKYKVK